MGEAKKIGPPSRKSHMRAKTLTQTYTFTLEEMIVLREALMNYKHHITPERWLDSSANRLSNLAITNVLLEQIVNNIRHL